jgi:hypothetical protein
MAAHAAAIALLVTAALGVAGYVVRPAFSYDELHLVRLFYTRFMPAQCLGLL